MKKRRTLRVIAILFAVAALVLLMGLPASAAMDPIPPSEPASPAVDPALPGEPGAGSMDPMDPIPPLDPLLPDSPVTQGDTPTYPSDPPSEPAGGPGTEDPNLIDIAVNGEGSDIVRILLIVTLVSLLPSLLIMMTSFTRIVIVFSLLRNAIGLQQTPPNQVLIGLALFLSLFIMRPVITDLYENSYQPFADGEMNAEEFIDSAETPLKRFMLSQTKPEDLSMFVELAGEERPANDEEIGMTVVVPSFIVSEIKRGFTIGFFVYIPFLVLDMVVASALMSMGMMMLPPVTISLPFKLMLFVLVDGWGLLIKTLVQTYHMDQYVV